jgi:hypothetical protein
MNPEAGSARVVLVVAICAVYGFKSVHPYSVILMGSRENIIFTRIYC